MHQICTSNYLELVRYFFFKFDQGKKITKMPANEFIFNHKKNEVSVANINNEFPLKRNLQIIKTCGVFRGWGCTLLEELGEGVAARRVDRLELLDLVESVDVFVPKLDRHKVRVVVQSQTHRALHTSLLSHTRGRSRRTRSARPELDAVGAISGRAPPPRTPPGAAAKRRRFCD